MPYDPKDIPATLDVRSGEFQEWHCWEGTRAENWRLDQAGTLKFK